MLVLMLTVLFAAPAKTGEQVCATAPEGESRLFVAVVDPNGEAIEDATIEVRSRSGAAFSRSTVGSSRTKAYFNVPPGEYRVHASRQGFDPQERKITLQPGCIDGLMLVLPVRTSH